MNLGRILLCCSLISTTAIAAPKPVILDVDPGIDDALAILLAVRSPELDVRAMTVVFGNVELELGVSNALKLLELAGRTDIPVATRRERRLSWETRSPPRTFTARTASET